MATSTFHKNIVIDDKAADRLIEILNKPAPPMPKFPENYWAENERKVKEWLSRSKKQSSEKK
ncbi:MAG: hypothetical protein FWG70_09020 [Oscillospiraceae bacterium]|nr:hypothetical protein [Oscillospiraceae bacterium]